jgi:transcriptional regulator of acetoin/glycerol metabolism
VTQRSFTQVALDDIVPEVVRRLSAMTIDELLTVLPCIESTHGTGNETAASFDDLARSILALPSRSRLRDAERAVVAHALAEAKGNVSAAARLLGIDRKALERKIRRHGLGRTMRGR